MRYQENIKNIFFNSDKVLYNLTTYIYAIFYYIIQGDW